MTRGVQHYFPASLIGQFSTSRSGPRRERPVIAVDVVKQTVQGPAAAQDFGYYEEHPHLYGEPEASEAALDDVWSGLEVLLDRVEQSVKRSADRKLQNSELFGLWIPYVAQLLARVPAVSRELDDDLRMSLHGATSRADRFVLFERLKDVFACGSQWSILVSDSEPLLETDTGFVYLPSGSGGALVVPVTPRLAFFVERRSPKSRREPVRHSVWTPEDIAVVNDLLALSAGRHVFVPDISTGEDVVQLVSEEREPRRTYAGLGADHLMSLMHEGALTAFAVAGRGAPGVEYARVARSKGCAVRDPEQSLASARSRRDSSKMQLAEVLEWETCMGVACMVGRGLTAVAGPDGFTVSSGLTPREVSSVHRLGGSPFRTSR